MTENDGFEAKKKKHQKVERKCGPWGDFAWIHSDPITPYSKMLNDK